MWKLFASLQWWCGWNQGQFSSSFKDKNTLNLKDDVIQSNLIEYMISVAN